MKFKEKKLRSVNTRFWVDPYIAELAPNEKLLFLYLLTNLHANLIGIYEISLKQIEFDTGLSLKEINVTLEKFKKSGKVDYFEGYIIMINFIKNQKFNPSMEKGARALFETLPDRVGTHCIQAGYNVSQVEEEDKDKDKEEDKGKVKFFSSDFEEFYSRYEYEGNKDDCYRLWQRIDIMNQELIKRRLQAYLDETDPDGKTGKFRKLPENYLKDEVWKHKRFCEPIKSEHKSSYVAPNLDWQPDREEFAK